MLTVEMNIMRDAEKYDFQLYAYLNFVRGIDMHIVEQNRILGSIL